MPTSKEREATWFHCAGEETRSFQIVKQTKKRKKNEWERPSSVKREKGKKKKKRSVCAGKRTIDQRKKKVGTVEVSWPARGREEKQGKLPNLT